MTNLFCRLILKITVKIRTPEKIAVIILKFEHILQQE